MRCDLLDITRGLKGVEELRGDEVEARKREESSSLHDRSSGDADEAFAGQIVIEKLEEEVRNTYNW